MREQRTPCINASRGQVLRGLHMTYADDRVCDSCLVAATHAATSDRVVTATRSAGNGVTGFQVPSSAPFPAFSLPDSSATSSCTPVAPLATSQVER